MHPSRHFFFGVSHFKSSNSSSFPGAAFKYSWISPKNPHLSVPQSPPKKKTPTTSFLRKKKHTSQQKQILDFRFHPNNLFLFVPPRALVSRQQGVFLFGLRLATWRAVLDQLHRFSFLVSQKNTWGKWFWRDELDKLNTSRTFSCGCFVFHSWLRHFEERNDFHLQSTHVDTCTFRFQNGLPGCWNRVWGRCHKSFHLTRISFWNRRGFPFLLHPPVHFVEIPNCSGPTRHHRPCA